MSMFSHIDLMFPAPTSSMLHRGLSACSHRIMGRTTQRPPEQPSAPQKSLQLLLSFPPHAYLSPCLQPTESGRAWFHGGNPSTCQPSNEQLSIRVGLSTASASPQCPGAVRSCGVSGMSWPYLTQQNCLCPLSLTLHQSTWGSPSTK